MIFLFMEGAVSQVDTFDHKPLLAKHHGEDPRRVIGKLEKTQFENIGTVLRSPWAFRRHGENGLWVSELFPHVARRADELCVIRSMTSKFPEHTSANYLLHSGTGVRGGQVYGETDDWGYKTVRDRLEIHDLHAAVLHLLGLDHTRLTFRLGGRDIRLTDVYGRVVREILV